MRLFDDNEDLVSSFHLHSEVPTQRNNVRDLLRKLQLLAPESVDSVVRDIIENGVD